MHNFLVDIEYHQIESDYQQLRFRFMAVVDINQLNLENGKNAIQHFTNTLDFVRFLATTRKNESQLMNVYFTSLEIDVPTLLPILMEYFTVSHIHSNCYRIFIDKKSIDLIGLKLRC